MKWKDRPESENVEDRRSLGRTAVAVGGGGAILLFLAVLVGQYFGLDLRPLLKQIQQQAPKPDQEGQVVDPAQEESAKFAKVILGDTERIWTEQFRTVYGKVYEEPKLVLFSGQVESACG